MLQFLKLAMATCAITENIPKIVVADLIKLGSTTPYSITIGETNSDRYFLVDLDTAITFPENENVCANRGGRTAEPSTEGKYTMFKAAIDAFGPYTN